MIPLRRFFGLALATTMPLLGGCHQIHEAKARQLTRSTVEAFEARDFDKAMEHSEIALRLGAKEPILHRVRGVILRMRGDLEGSLRETETGLAMASSTEEGALDETVVAAFHGMRSNTLRALGRSAEGLAALEEADGLDPEDPEIQNNLAWLLATAMEDALRDGKRAVEHGRRACELTDWEEAGVIDTLAAAYAEAGDFAEALKWQREALAKATGPEKARNGAEFETRLKLYEAGTPYREDPVAEYRAEMEKNKAAKFGSDPEN